MANLMKLMSFPIILQLDVRSRENHFFPTGEPGTSLILRLAREVWASGSILSRRGNPLVTIIYVFKGSGEFRTPQGHMALGPGAVFGFGPDIPHSVSMGAADLHIGLVALEPTQGGQLVQRNFRQTTIGFQTADGGEVEDEFLRIFAIARAGEALAQERAEALLLAWLHTLRKAMQTESPRDSCGAEIVRRSMRYLRENFQGLNSAQSAARACGVSYSHMTRLFRQHAGLSPHQYLLRLKMLYAAQRISTEPLKLDEIAEELGFADAFVFSKAFKRVLGLSPQVYRRAC